MNLTTVNRLSRPQIRNYHTTTKLKDPCYSFCGTTTSKSQNEYDKLRKTFDSLNVSSRGYKIDHSTNNVCSEDDKLRESYMCNMRSLMALNLIEKSMIIPQNKEINDEILNEMKEHQKHRREDLKCLKYDNDKKLSYLQQIMNGICEQNKQLDDLLKKYSNDVKNFDEIVNEKNDKVFWNSRSEEFDEIKIWYRD